MKAYIFIRNIFLKIIVAFTLFVLVFPDTALKNSLFSYNVLIQQVAKIIREKNNYQISVLLLAAYMLVFNSACCFVSKKFQCPDFAKVTLASAFIFWVAFVSVATCIVCGVSSSDGLIFCVSLVLGQATAYMSRIAPYKLGPNIGVELTGWAIFCLIALFCLARTLPDYGPQNFEYHNRVRWAGPWNNPNMAGLLLGVGAVLAIGFQVGSVALLAEKQKEQWDSRNYIAKQYGFVISAFLLGAYMASGTLLSYSRGAWLGIICGFSYLILVLRTKHQMSGYSKIFKTLSSSCALWLMRNWRPLVVILIATTILFTRDFSQSSCIFSSRSFSAINQNDFSWRNRVAAWEGDLQMMVEKPWLGFGWGSSERIYEYYYLSPKLIDGAAIEMNDYLLLGATLGIPALFCFGIYLWLMLTQKIGVSSQVLELKSRKSEQIKTEWLQNTCRAGAIVLLVGFWFDGGLFRLATASTFWILLELGNVQNHHLPPNKY